MTVKSCDSMGMDQGVSPAPLAPGHGPIPAARPRTLPVHVLPPAVGKEWTRVSRQWIWIQWWQLQGDATTGAAQKWNTPWTEFSP